MSNSISLKGAQSTLIDVLNALMKRANINVSQLSKNIDLAHTTVKRMCTDPDSNPTLSSIIKISQFFGITPNQLIGTEPLHHDTNSYYPDFNTWRKVPILTFAQLKNWPKHAEKIKKIPEIKQALTDIDISEHAFAIITEDSALEPKFSEGTVLIFDPARSPRNKDLVIVQIENKTLPQFRQILLDGSDHYVKPMNPDFSSQTPLLLKNRSNIFGVLVQAKSNYF